MRQHDTNHPALDTLDPLLGEWRQWSLVEGAPGGRIGPIPTSCARTPDGGFLVRRADLAPDTAAHFTMLYADGRGVSRVPGSTPPGTRSRVPGRRRRTQRHGTRTSGSCTSGPRACDADQPVTTGFTTQSGWPGIGGVLEPYSHGRRKPVRSWPAAFEASLM